ncbi:UNVERIFIED_CONTAM: hypothetical protein Scaly_2546100 [Sesamum calycinum]|uniref:Uncharacterized protein n=1 Tax=Sesamum calycinum TaxID=2727403 RepID=A0AAW2J483_9LAMI
MVVQIKDQIIQIWTKARPTRVSSQGSRQTNARSTERTPTRRTFRRAHTRANKSFKDCNSWTCGARGHISSDYPQKHGELRKFEAIDDILDAVYYGDLVPIYQFKDLPSDENMKEYIEIPRIFKEFCKVGAQDPIRIPRIGIVGRENESMTLGLSILKDHKPWGRKGSGICTAKSGVFPKEAKKTLPIITGRNFPQKILLLNKEIREAKIMIGGAFGTPWFMGLINSDSFQDEYEEEIKNLKETLQEIKSLDIGEESKLSLEKVKSLIERNFSENPLAWWDRNKIETILKVNGVQVRVRSYKPIQMNMEDKKDMQVIIKEHINLRLIEPRVSAYNSSGFLEFLLDETGIELQDHIVEKIHNFPDVLKDKKHLQNFSGVVNFSNIFIKDLTRYKKDFRPRLKKIESTKLKWEEIHTQRVRELKQKASPLGITHELREHDPKHALKVHGSKPAVSDSSTNCTKPSLDSGEVATIGLRDVKTPDDSSQPSTSGLKDGEISLRNFRKRVSPNISFHEATEARHGRGRGCGCARRNGPTNPPPVVGADALPPPKPAIVLSPIPTEPAMRGRQFTSLDQAVGCTTTTPTTSATNDPKIVYHPPGCEYWGSPEFQAHSAKCKVNQVANLDTTATVYHGESSSIGAHKSHNSNAPSNRWRSSKSATKEGGPPMERPESSRGRAGGQKRGRFWLQGPPHRCWNLQPSASTAPSPSPPQSPRHDLDDRVARLEELIRRMDPTWPDPPAP